MNPNRALFLLLALAAPLPAAAHSDEYLDTLSAPHGGQLRMAREYHYELVVELGSLTVYVTDHGDRKFDTAGARGRAIVLAGGTKTYVPLSPAGDNRLAGKGDFAADPAMKVVVSISLPGGPELSARFTPLAPRPAAGRQEPSAGHVHDRGGAQDMAGHDHGEHRH